jgi:hypothetical protein
MSVALLTLYTVEYANWEPKLGMASVSTFLIGFNLSSATILWIYMSDTLNDTAVTVAAFSIWIFFGGQTRGVSWAAEEKWNYATLFMICFVISLVGLTFFTVFIVETKGKTQTQIWKTMNLSCSKVETFHASELKASDLGENV